MNQTNDRSGLLADLLKQLNLVWKLLLDARVPASTKLLLPLMALAYVIFPIDLIPDVLPVLGQLDDLAIVLLAVRLFVMLAPPDVVAFHRGQTPADSATPDDSASAPGSGAEAKGRVVDGTYRVMDK